MYQNIKSFVRHGTEYLQYLYCEIGVRQGENLFPFLFSMYLIDFENYLLKNNVKSLETASTQLLENLHLCIFFS